MIQKNLAVTLKIIKKYIEIQWKNLEKSWNFVSPEKWEPCLCNGMVQETETRINVPYSKLTFLVKYLVMDLNVLTEMTLVVRKGQITECGCDTQFARE